MGFIPIFILIGRLLNILLYYYIFYILIIIRIIEYKVI